MYPRQNNDSDRRNPADMGSQKSDQAGSQVSCRSDLAGIGAWTAEEQSSLDALQHTSAVARSTSSPNNIVPSEAHPNSSTRQHQPSAQSDQPWQAVPRTWGNISPEADRMTRITTFDQNGALHPHVDTDSVQSDDENQDTASVERLRSENQREGPWDGVGRVRSRGEDSKRRD